MTTSIYDPATPPISDAELSTPQVRDLKAQLRQQLADVQQTAMKAEAERRDFTEAERKTVTDGMGRAHDLKAQLRTAEKAALTAASDRQLKASVRELGDLIGLEGASGSPLSKSTGRQTEWTKRFAAIGVKALDPSGRITAPPAFDPDVHGIGTPPRFLQAILPTVGMQGEQFRYLRQTARDNNAAAVDRGAVKPTSVYSIEDVEDRAVVVAHLSEPVPRQLLNDVATMEEFVGVELQLGLALEVERQLVAGDPAAVAGRELQGLATVSGTQVQAFDGSPLRTLRRAIGKVETIGLAAATHVLLNPTDWEAIELTVDSQGRYLLNAGPVDRAQARIWGAQVVATNAVAAGTAWVGDFASQARLYVREDAVVDWSESMNENFQRNLRSYRCEGRYGAAWLRPAAFVEATLTGV